MRHWSLASLVLIVVCQSLGCGNSKTEEQTEPVSLQNAIALRQSVEEDLLGEGAEGPLKQRVTNFSENIEGYDEDEMGEYADTFKEIRSKFAELKKLVDSNGSQAEIKKVMDELKALAEKLPERKPAAQE